MALLSAFNDMRPRRIESDRRLLIDFQNRIALLSRSDRSAKLTGMGNDGVAILLAAGNHRGDNFIERYQSWQGRVAGRNQMPIRLRRRCGRPSAMLTAMYGSK
ncbi:MAG: hypothetical protein FJ145_26345 [Deltaproteobacteria bacterium]|nr:hypothetical protein [Deltaproteobacteria bacterium]